MLAQLIKSMWELSSSYIRHINKSPKEQEVTQLLKLHGLKHVAAHTKLSTRSMPAGSMQTSRTGYNAGLCSPPLHERVKFLHILYRVTLTNTSCQLQNYVSTACQYTAHGQQGCIDMSPAQILNFFAEERHENPA